MNTSSSIANDMRKAAAVPAGYSHASALTYLAALKRKANAHAGLVEALTVAQTALEANGWAHDVPNAMRQIRAALQSAKEAQ